MTTIYEGRADGVYFFDRFKKIIEEAFDYVHEITDDDLRERGIVRLFVEGGNRFVSAFVNYRTNGENCEIGVIGDERDHKNLKSVFEAAVRDDCKNEIRVEPRVLEAVA